ncbi:dipeptidase [Dyella halodurans]|uniref:Dipeptidase n=1 Tax=Dyella halodurans TaxID=1920171 RepID=A0ABV9C2C0_9GAMM|nr:dipeptidase [Dyella halodurans]
MKLTARSLPVMTAMAVALMLCGSSHAATPSDAALAARVDRVLAATPLIDGHNDLPWAIRTGFGNIAGVDLSANTASLPMKAEAGETPTPLMTDIPRLRAGHVGGQFWSVWIPPTVTGPAAVKMTLEQIDIVRTMVVRYPHDLQMAYSAEDIVSAHKAGRIASLIGIEGGHQIDNSLPVLRSMYVLGARYMTLTHTLNNDWADSATDAPKHHGLTPFGRAVVHEMNRLGMLVDLSHVSADTMRDALNTSVAPVMFSHSGARALDDHPRDVPDDVLKMVARNRGIVMATFAGTYVSAERARWEADRAAEQTRFNAPPYAGLYIGQPERAKAAMAEWDRQHPRPMVTLAMVADHIEHIRQVAGIDCVGIGSDFDGIPNTPQGLEGVDKYPALLQELARRGWSDEDLGKLAGGNMLRVMREAAAVAKRLQATEAPSTATIAQADAAVAGK